MYFLSEEDQCAILQHAQLESSMLTYPDWEQLQPAIQEVMPEFYKAYKEREKAQTRLQETIQLLMARLN